MCMACIFWNSKSASCMNDFTLMKAMTEKYDNLRHNTIVISLPKTLSLASLRKTVISVRNFFCT